MKTNRNTAKPTKHLIDRIHKMGGTMKGIKTYRDAENYIKRLARTEKKTPCPANKPCECHKQHKTVAKARPSNPGDGYSCKHREALKKKDAADRLPVIKNGCDTVRIRLPKLTLSKTDAPDLSITVRGSDDLAVKFMSIVSSMLDFADLAIDIASDK